MSAQASVRSIESLKDFRVVLSLYGDDTLGALGGIEAEVRRTIHWLHDDRPYYWQDQIKRRREAVASAKAELFRRKLQKTADNSPAMSEQKEKLRKAEFALQDAEHRLIMVRKWQPMFQQAVLEYKASVRRIRDLAAGDVPRAVNLLSRIIDALEAYVRETPPASPTASGETSTAAPPEFEKLATKTIDEEPDVSTTIEDGDPYADVERPAS